MTKTEMMNMRELAKACRSRMEFYQKYKREYRRIRKAGDEVADLIFADIPCRRREAYTREELERIAQRYESRTEWQLRSQATYRAARHMGIFEQIAPPSQRGKWRRQ